MKEDKLSITIEKLNEILPKVFDKKTAHRKYRGGWSPENPCYGQCVPTALLVQYYFGGEIYKHNIYSHYYNYINGKFFDLTKDQFKTKIDYSNGKPKQPILSQSHTLERFELLKSRVEEYLQIHHEII